MKYTLQQVWSYVGGFASSQSIGQELSMNEILAMLKNALACIEDGDDGLAAYLERIEYYKKLRYNNHMQQTFTREQVLRAINDLENRMVIEGYSIVLDWKERLGFGRDDEAVAD